MIAPPVGRKLIPIERELQERLTWFIRLRWLAAAGILLGAWLATTTLVTDLPSAPLYLVGLAVLAYNVVFRIYSPKAEGNLPKLRRLIFLQIGLDWLALIVLVHYSGGIRSPVTLAFIFHLIIAAILLSRRSCYLLAASASLLLGIQTVAEQFGFLSPPTVPEIYSPVPGSFSGFFTWIALTGLFLVTTYLATSITTQLREKEKALSASERSRGRAYREMEALYRLGQVMNSTLDFKEVLALIAENAARLLGMKACFIRLFDKTGKKLYIGGAFGLSQAYIDKGPVELEKSLIDSETLAGGAVQALDVTIDPRFQYREEARKEGLVSVLCVPVSAKQKVLGVIRVYSAERHEFTEQEQNLLKNLANLGAVAIENAQSYADLQALNDEKIWFARMTHHQLRAPLAAISGTLDALPYAGTLTGKQDDLVARARRRVQDAFETIRDLLDLAAAQRPLKEREGESVLLAPALERAIETAGERARNKGIVLRVEIPAGTQVFAQPADIDRIFSNLLDNGVKYTPTGGQVSLLVDQRNGEVYTKVSDSGIGIGSEDLEKIFEGFYRTQEAKSSGEMGTGLGLSIVKKLVDRWGGRLELESKRGKGTSFTIILPAADR
jgi:signal transduction histidine kinase